MNNRDGSQNQGIDATIAALVPTYLARREAEIPVLIAALAAGDLHAAGRIGHKFAGSGRTYGFAELSTLGQALQAACIEGEVADAQRLAGELQQLLGAARRQL